MTVNEVINTLQRFKKKYPKLCDSQCNIRFKLQPGLDWATNISAFPLSVEQDSSCANTLCTIYVINPIEPRMAQDDIRLRVNKT